VTGASACLTNGKAYSEKAKLTVTITARDRSIHKRSVLASWILVHLILPAAAGINVDIRIADEGNGSCETAKANCLVNDKRGAEPPETAG
jgi:hypothetical protein